MASITFQQSNGTEVRIKLVAATISFGKGDDNDIVLEDAAISKRHGEISFKDGSFFITDLGSTNGIIIDGEEISTHRLRPGDRIEIGTLTGVFSDESTAPKEDTPAATQQSIPSNRTAPKVGPARSKKDPRTDTRDAQDTPYPKVPRLPSAGKPARQPSLQPSRSGKSVAAGSAATINPHQQQEGMGFYLFLMQFLVVVVAMAGLTVRHMIETGGFFPADAFNAIRYIEKDGPVYDSEGNLVEDAAEARAE